MNIQKVGVLIGLLITTASLEAQVAISQGVVSLKNTTAQVFINTTFTNRGKVSQQGKLAIEGDLLNYAHYRADEGTLKLSGLDQLVYSDSQLLGEIRIANGYTKTLEGNFQLQRKLVLEDGTLVVPEKSQLTLLDDATISQSNSNSYIWGTLYHQGTGAKFYPVGNRDEYAPVTLNNIEGSVAKVGVRYNPVSGQPCWFQHLAEGTYEGSAVTVSFPSNNPDYFSYSEQLVVMTGADKDQVNTSIGAEIIETSNSQITVSSQEVTDLPWIAVGFMVDEAEEELFVPNAFSPQAPHPDDRIIKVYGRYLSSQNFQFGIQDTWGRWVYQTTSLEEAMREGWSAATLSSSSLQFRYIVSGKFISGRTFQRSDVIVKF